MYSMFSKLISLNEDQFCHYLTQTVFAWFHCPVYVRLNFAVNWNYNCTMEFNRILYEVAFEFPYPYDFTSFYFKSWTNQKFTNKILVKLWNTGESLSEARVSVKGIKSLGSHFACLCRGFEFYEVKKKLLLFFKK